MPSSVPDDWDMDSNPDQNHQQKRKQASSPTTDTPIKKKTLNNPITSKTPAPTTTDSDGALSAANRATDRICLRTRTKPRRRILYRRAHRPVLVKSRQSARTSLQCPEAPRQEQMPATRQKGRLHRGRKKLNCGVIKNVINTYVTFFKLVVSEVFELLFSSIG